MSLIQQWMQSWCRRLRLGPDDLLRDVAYRRLWTSVLISSFGGQVTMLALPLTAAVLLQATPTQMGLLTALETLPFILFSLPAGVWVDRLRKLPMYVAGELLLSAAIASVPLAWWLDWLSMGWMYVVGFILGTVSTTAGIAAQVVLTQVVERERLVEAHAKNSLATSGAEVAGPGMAGLLIKLFSAPVALLVDALMLVISAAILRGIRIYEVMPLRQRGHFWRDLGAGVRFVRGTRLLLALALAVGVWQMAHHAAMVVQILYATRELGMTEQQVGLSYIAMGLGTVLASLAGKRVSQRIGPGPTLILGFAVTGCAWLLLALAPGGWWGRLAFAGMLMLFSVGAVFCFISFLSLRQAVTPAPLLGRMTSTMRWLTLMPAGPGALIGGWLGEHVGLRSALGFAAGTALLLAAVAWQQPILRSIRCLPKPQDPQDELGADAGPASVVVAAPGAALPSVSAAR